MSEQKTSKQLLPVGFYDLLFDEAEKNHENINVALAAFRAGGYRLIKTPLVEFEDSFAQEDTLKNTFRATDVISGKNIVFRNDITPQISRLMATRLKKENFPIKLCYSGDVLCAKSDNLYADRQQTQVGIEIICDQANKDGETYDIEAINSLLVALQNLKVKDALIEFSLPDFLDVFLAELGIQNSDALRSAIMQKDLSEIRNLLDSHDKVIADIIGNIVLSNNDLVGLSQKISAHITSAKISAELKKAEVISDYLTQHFPEVELRFDLFGDHSSTYHSGISFDVFSGSFSYPIASGGRYNINDLKAVGATIYINRLLKSIAV